MPFSHRNKELLGGGAALRLFAYHSTETASELIKKDYFQYWSELEVNDFILIKCADAAFISVVRSKNPTVIDSPDDPWGGEDGAQPAAMINRLRKTARELGINSFGRSIKELTEEINAKQGIKI